MRLSLFRRQRRLVRAQARLAKALAIARFDSRDYEQRWLAECRDHGVTERALLALEDEVRGHGQA